MGGIAAGMDAATCCYANARRYAGRWAASSRTNARKENCWQCGSRARHSANGFPGCHAGVGTESFRFAFDPGQPAG